ncbi:MAG: porin [Pseudomonadota bacterium]|nr:porin [Pseudomonadota bacterium]
MIRKTLVSALLGGSALILSGTAYAQQAEQPDQSDATADAAIASAAPVDDQQAKIELLEAQVQALQQSIEALKAQVANTAPSWKGAPQVADKESGFSFKPRGRLMYDFATVNGPDGYDNPGLGFSNEVRRARLGVEGTIPGDFGYKFEVDFAAGDVEFADAYFSYAPGDVELILGQHNNFQSLEELTSSLHTSFIERAAFTDAFGFERRVGVSAQYLKGPILAQGGVFTDSITDLNAAGDDNNSYGFDTRLVFMPTLGSNQLHFAGSYHWRDINDAAMSVRYRQRPAVHTTDVRFIDTGSIAGAEKETGYGVEAAGIFGPFHLASEAYWQKVSRAGFENPTFFGAYVEGGYFLTGESRGYKAGRFDRVKVKNPFGKEGGWGALSLNLRWDFLDLIDAGIVGGKQNAYQASLNWKPVDYVLFGLNYAHIRYDDAAIATTSGDRDYSIDMLGLRSQIDF